MTDARAVAALVGGNGLLERAVNYTLGSLHLVTPEGLSHPTPCRDWDLRALLDHLHDSLVALHEAVDAGHVALDAAVGLDLAAEGGDGGVEPVARVRTRARQLVGACARSGTADSGTAHCGTAHSGTAHSGTARPDGDRHLVTIAGAALTAGIVTSAGAIEVAVHGWDVARACRRPHPVPPSLAEEMLEFAPLLVTSADRPGRFAAPVEVSSLAGAGDRLVAFLGRPPS
jgi:uncharacterized protein (TIGR03083 family)